MPNDLAGTHPGSIPDFVQDLGGLLTITPGPLKGVYMDSGKLNGKYYIILGLGFKDITPSNGESNGKECGKLGGKWNYIGGCMD